MDKHRITLRTWAEKDLVCAEVVDDGPGIPPENLDHIFDPFFYPPDTHQGAGLGLAICQNIVTAFGGSIQVESPPGQGTRFLLRFPALSAAPEEKGPRETPEPASASPASPVRGRSLVVDDEDGILTLLKGVLGPAHEVVCVASGKEGQALLAQDASFDLILCDLMMPEVTGMALHHWITQRHPALAGKVIFMTGGVFTSQASEYVASAGVPVLDKPFKKDALRKRVAELVQAARGRK